MKITINTSSTKEYDAIFNTLTDLEVITDTKKACELINRGAMFENNAFNAKLNSSGNDLEIEINEKVVLWALRLSKKFFRIFQTIGDLITDSMEETEGWFDKLKVTFKRPSTKTKETDANNSDADKKDIRADIYRSITDLFEVYPGIGKEDLKQDLLSKGYPSDDVNRAVEWFAL